MKSVINHDGVYRYWTMINAEEHPTRCNRIALLAQTLSSEQTSSSLFMLSSSVFSRRISQHIYAGL